MIASGTRETEKRKRRTATRRAEEGAEAEGQRDDEEDVGPEALESDRNSQEDVDAERWKAGRTCEEDPGSEVTISESDTGEGEPGTVGKTRGGGETAHTSSYVPGAAWLDKIRSYLKKGMCTEDRGGW
ncbi:hypothetical protein NDU88_005377 [Pleurodeles waltl]|uniref:Uncharacterized protein n=1 Tax=Pleurodeles waltl TaxID=8319 RepID=A0AAV7TU62_PLEWA|nr:hypothetical protein NDU88_005377 [Pleurodeles waltl]